MPKTAKIKLSKIDTRAPKSISKEQAKKEMEILFEEIDELQNMLYAEHKHSLLIIIQGMDASGKDGLVRDVFSHVNPSGVVVHSFKVPTEEELSHDFLWRIHSKVPGKGMIHVFNRSQYEDVLVTRVHGSCDAKLAAKRMKAINEFEQLLEQHNNTVVLKLYLHLSKEEQLIRLKERMTIPSKMWKYNANDIVESQSWDQYMKYYEEVFEQCNEVPWHIIPADQNWYKSHTVATLIHKALKGLKMQYPGMKK
ncbi:polyphosphate kinase [Taibaiella sp. KBW10]|uniref:PPK2 family polyphosphate kinase n=1 Tax=Taibaiella sp. KBW10 TaxID=2153357 RepID=UPI000F5AD48B|nr:PPK2 family polyphosphate kinase [Taibaiella sp. KBW10]RQO31242.1 polyphosphate kinase [Taibaiella sp. KBW10]